MAKDYATPANAVRAVTQWAAGSTLPDRRGWGVAVMALPSGRFVPFIYTGHTDDFRDHSAEQLSINLAQAGFYSTTGAMPIGLKEAYK